ncbi:MAG: response regulator transcription factor [Bacteroidaceae bacterium]|nr:response regulator transcription factor [Bacteroidaceae bacterium]
MEKPCMAVIGKNALVNIGLKSILEKMFSFLEIKTFTSVEELLQDEGIYYHYFVTAELLLANPAFFVKNHRKTIVLAEEDSLAIPEDFHRIYINVTESRFLKQVLELEQRFHHNLERFPQDLANMMRAKARDSVLTPREIEVLRCVAKGMSSKEISNELKISFSTVLTHRKNIMDKLDAHSATKLVIYAVHNGYVDVGEIRG